VEVIETACVAGGRSSQGVVLELSDSGRVKAGRSKARPYSRGAEWVGSFLRPARRDVVRLRTILLTDYARLLRLRA
jgi:hypothetical protein